MTAASVPRFSGAKVVDARNRRGITQAELARRARVHAAQLSRWENGRQTPGADAVGMLAAALDCDVSEFWERADRDDDDDRAMRLRRLAADLAERRGMEHFVAELLAIAIDLGSDR